MYSLFLCQAGSLEVKEAGSLFKWREFNRGATYSQVDGTQEK